MRFYLERMMASKINHVIKPALACLLSAVTCGHVQAQGHDIALRGLLRAAYQNMATTHECRDIIGPSGYVLARAKAANAFRLTGMPTDVAFRAVEKMVRKIEKNATKKTASSSLSECIAMTRQSEGNLRLWQSKIDGSTWR